jgi:hypothetical protein
MKRFVLPIIMVFALVSCTKSHIAGTEQIEGNWELREMANGLAGTIKYKPGNGVIMRFNNKAYQFSIPSLPDRTGSYIITPAKNPGDYKLIIQYFSNGNAMQESDSIRFTNNQLVFLSAETCCDIPIVYYERIP